MNGIIIINKEQGLTSRDVVNKLIRILNTKKIGHTGTLDPIAKGVLVVTVGRATKLCELLTSEYKEYIATMKLGIETDTLDITGNTIKEKEYNVNVDKIKEVLNSFLGKSIQEVPKYSAIKVNGKRLYEYARENIDVELPRIKVSIKDIELLDYGIDFIKIKCLVSKGTYIRSLIRDICKELKVLGCMSDLIRTKQGTFSIDNSWTLEDISNNNFKSLTLEDVLKITKIELDDNLYKKVVNGNKIIAKYNGYVLFQKKEQDIALYYFENGEGVLKILL